MDNTLVYIVRGLPAPLDKSIAQALAEYLEARQQRPSTAKPGTLFYLLDAASRLMLPLEEYDFFDFKQSNINEALELLATGDEQLWAQLLEALNYSDSPYFTRLKQLSPYADSYLAFFEPNQDPAKIHLELEESLGAELLRRADAHDFPGNGYVIVVSEACLDKMRFVDGNDDIPATV